ncbi:mediator complex subunit 13 C-terminal-domain-containing protein [Hygrophoropsis aurantiaca]|uniref:Mediator complex subunit 13 C-terminal-domain-containing protein n=1 Tax=Hygrophoropsis aurantiaca TaxID=72124 RepID=A0ACB8AFU3_9AGAM|nr:mediator complex subunit 13 C-terminal-domain-containing protein [Hygrophoropsis aurantiaca]
MASRAVHIPSPAVFSSSTSISASDNLLASILSLPDNPCIICATFLAAPEDGLPQESLESARQHLLERNKSLPLWDCWLPSVKFQQEAPALYVFAVVACERMDSCKSDLRSLNLTGLTLSELLSFQPQDLYPCSTYCADQRSPCSTCLHPPSLPSASTSTSSSALLLPRKPLRNIYAHFLDAVRTRVIDDIVEASRDNSLGASALRLKNGVLLSSSSTMYEWGMDWQHNAHLRPLILCDLELRLTPSRVEIHSMLRATEYIPFYTSPPLPTGTPIALLPYGTPAFFLNSYSGPTSRLTAQFEQSLSGLGAGEWKAPRPPFAFSASKRKSCRPEPFSGKNVMYIIAWLAVQNKQGEDKGMPVIWPSRLCVSFLPSSSSAHARRALSYIPELPSQLQPSPPPPAPPAISIASPSAMDQDSSPISQSHPIHMARPITRRACSAPATESISAFRSLILTKPTTIAQVAAEVGSYVESVAKEREKERERIRRERETAHVSASPRGIITPPAGPALTSGPSSTPSVAVETPSTTSTLPANLAPSTGPAPSTVAQALPQPHTFYPSPPVTNGPHSTTAEVHAPQTSEIIPEIVPPSAATTIVQTDSISGLPAYDPFANMDSSWAQPSNDFMTYEMGFGMNMDEMPTGGGNGNGTTDRLGSMDYEDGFTFTDDDFSFFDGPSAPSRPAAAAPSEVSTGLTPAAGPAPMGLSPSLFGENHFSSNGPAATPAHYSSPWGTSGTVDGFTPRFADHPMQDLITPAPDLMPSSPGMTASSHSAPATPQVHIFGAEHHRALLIAHNFFDPIPFAPSHRITDSKYAMGKFALPSPPDEEDRTEPIPVLSSPARIISSWKLRYNAATDPRIGVVRKLIGVKRKSFDQGSREYKNAPTWIQQHEDWASTAVLEDAEDTKSDIASEDDDIDDDPPAPSRASTPPPAYLPIGPTLLHMQFHHSCLLPLSSPLKPPGAAVAPMGIPTAVPAFAPTPVSPAAVLGTASEKSKSLEAAGYMIAKEVVENMVWAKAWRLNNISTTPSNLSSDIWYTDVSSLSEILAKVPSLSPPPSLQVFFELASGSSSQETSLQPLEPPMLSVAKGDSVIQILPSAMRFHEKLGLGPRGGKKDVRAFVFYEDEGPERQEQIELWLGNVSAMYTGKHLGSHLAGSSNTCPKNGIVPLHLESLRKHLALLIASLPTSSASLVFYIVIPDSAMSLSSPLLRQVFTAVKNVQRTYSEAHIHFQFVPECLVQCANQDADMEALCYSVFQRILCPVDRYMSRRLFDHGERSRSYFQEPLVTIARPLVTRVQFTQQTPADTLDVIDRHTLLHIGYSMSECGKWLLAACIDQRGEAYDLSAWLTQEESESAAIGQLWDFAQRIARKANIEWRMVFTKLGSMSVSELDAWTKHLSASDHDGVPFQAIVSCVDQDPSLTIIRHAGNSIHPSPPKRSPSKDLIKPVYLDAASVTYALYPSTRIPLLSHLSSVPNACDSCFVPDCEDIPLSDTLRMLPISTSILIRPSVGAGSPSPTILHTHLLHTYKSPNSSSSISDDTTLKDITHNYYELSVLGGIMFSQLEHSILPLHLQALEIMHNALRQGDIEQV